MMARMMMMIIANTAATATTTYSHSCSVLEDFPPPSPPSSSDTTLALGTTVEERAGEGDGTSSMIRLVVGGRRELVGLVEGQTEGEGDGEDGSAQSDTFCSNSVSALAQVSLTTYLASSHSIAKFMYKPDSSISNALLRTPYNRLPLTTT